VEFPIEDKPDCPRVDSALPDPVQQDEWPPGTDLPAGQFNAIEASEPLHWQVRYEHWSTTPGSAARSTLLAPRTSH
jgi:hypothetical protein